ncbi:hypothetical protein [Anaerosalibacter sp. Marseille-P3206]|uniref:hypothetical protein n=1 Tax=Anaerosalibacter sp. Marseille-P3206 TaxID=1871005 RepID=UPI0009862567|nr:hypothetical protein [Anaerosalibacter sp. Marseille-P3206]
MSFYNQKSSIVTDSLGNIFNLEWRDGVIIGYYFNRFEEEIEKVEIANNVLEEYDVAIRSDDCIYLIYQGNDKHLYLSNIFKEEKEITQITESPIPHVYNLQLLLDGDDIHIFYDILIDEGNKVYRIYHHHYNNNHWNTNIVEDTRVLNILNPINIICENEKIYIIFYDLVENEEIFVKTYDIFEQIWSNKTRLTYDTSSKLYLDTLLENNILHLTYSKYIDGNFGISYINFDISNNSFHKKVESIMSNIENCSHPILIKYLDKLWIIWLEYESIFSRYSTDDGSKWSNIYQWRESKHIDFVRYKYAEYPTKDSNKKLNYSFGKVYPDISFLGFGPLDNIIEIPLKKKKFLISKIPMI